MLCVSSSSASPHIAGSANCLSPPPSSAGSLQSEFPTVAVNIPAPSGVIDRVKRLRAFDLFTGTGSVKKVLSEYGWEVVSLDVNPKWGADIVEDVLTWDFRRFAPKSFDLICAPPLALNSAVP